MNHVETEENQKRLNFFVTIAKNDIVKGVPSATVKNLIDFLKKAERRKPVYLDEQLSEACMKNNDAKIALDEA